MSVGFSMFPSILISMISVKIIWLPSEEGLESQSGVVVRLSVMLMGLPVFATLLLARAPSDAIDPETRLILQATAEGNPPSVWSQTDCETTYSTRSSRSIE